MDKEKTGLLSKEKIQQGLNAANQKMTPSALKLLDLNADDYGLIDYKDWTNQFISSL